MTHHRSVILLQQLKGFEMIRAVHLESVPFDMERDLITPTYKKKRPQLLKYYQVLFIHAVHHYFYFAPDISR
jgi:long-chain acyl-CoA synthetase